MIERRLVLAPIIEDVCEIDARFRVLAVELERPTQRRNRRVVIAEPVLRVAHARHSLGRLRCLLHRGFEEALRDIEEIGALADRAFPKQGSSGLQHQVDVVAVAELQRSVKAAQRRFVLTELQQ